MIRYGTSRTDAHARQSPALSLHALCVSVVQTDLRVCRIPAAYITPLSEGSAAPLRALLQAYRLRLVVHAPITNPHTLEAWFATVIEFFAVLDAADAVIVCHLPDWSVAACRALGSLPAWIRRHLAIELTVQPTHLLLERLAGIGIPVVFDTLHYQQQTPWPYEPITALFACLDSWGAQRPLVHLSSQSTTLRTPQHAPPSGMHGDVLDTAIAVWYIRAVLEARRDIDIEIEANSGLVAYTQLMHALHRSMRTSRRSNHEWIRHA